MTIPDLSSRALAARTALLALCDALVSAADASHAGLAVPPPAPTPAPEGPVRLFPPVIVKTDVPPMVGEVCRSPAPEAKRPKWVRITRAPKDGWRVTTGKVYPVARWSEDSPLVTADDGTTVFLSRPDSKDTDSMGYPAWEPTPCPPPVAGRVGCDKEYAELVRAARLTVERIEHFGSVSSVETLRGALKDLDIALSRPVRP